MLTTEELARFQAKYRVTETPKRAGLDPCWIWTAPTPGDHPTFWLRGKSRRVAQLAWEIANDTAFPRSRVACHLCDDHLCVNPAHIYAGTRAENARDTRRNVRVVPNTTRIGLIVIPKHTSMTTVAQAIIETYT